ncbi:hypothetical protein Sste5344_004561 [Sporothrix stenoceras]
MQEIIAGVEADTTQLKFELSSVKAILRSKGNLHRLWLCFWTALSSQGIAILFIIFVFNFFNSICWVPLIVTYPLETVTTKQRSLFFALTMLTINASSFVSSFINPIGIQILSWRYYIFQCVFNALLTTIIYFTYAETSGLTIEEIAGIFCGEEQFQNALARPELEKMGVER